MNLAPKKPNVKKLSPVQSKTIPNSKKNDQKVNAQDNKNVLFSNIDSAVAVAKNREDYKLFHNLIICPKIYEGRRSLSGETFNHEYTPHNSLLPVAKV